MAFPIGKLPRPLLAPFSLAAEALAKTSRFAPPSVDGLTMDPEIALGLRAHYASNAPAMNTLPAAQAREEHCKQAGPYQPRARRKIETVDIVLGSVPARLYRGGASALMWIHGGGYVIGSIKSDDAVCRWMVEQTGMSIVSIDYRLAPEHPFPAAHDDGLTAWTALVERAQDLGLDPARIGIAGSSAGGNLAASTCIAARDSGVRMPAYQLLFYPVTDFTASFPSRQTLRDGYILDGDMIGWFKAQYITPKDWENPRVSLVLEPNLAGLPPAHVIAAGFDPLRDEACAYAGLLRDAGVPVHYELAEGLIHSFVDLSGLSSTSRKVTLSALQAAKQALDPQPKLSAGFHRPRVCVIGAGTSGIAACKALQNSGVPFVCYEGGDRIGGNWVFKNSNGVSAAYRSLHINTSRQAMEFRDFPMPDDYPDYPHHSLIAEYFDAYADHFNLRRDIQLNTWVAAVEPVAAPAGGPGKPGANGWTVTLADGTVEHFDAVMVGNGHHWDPQLPDPPYPGDFTGIELHSHSYIDPSEPADLVGKNVVVVGFGNSAMDIACELSQRGVANRVMLSVRSGGYVLPHYLLGTPTDQFGQKTPSIVPGWVARRALAGLYRAVVGDVQSYGLPKPNHKLLDAHPTVSSELLPRIGRGDIVVKPNIRAFEGPFVIFEDGTREPVDAIVWCTGYRVTFPFLDTALISAPGNDIPLYKRVVPPEIDGLFFLGLIQPLGAVMPLVEAQCKWLSDVLTGDAPLPDKANMEADMKRERKAMFARYVPSKRHTLQVDFKQYLEDVQSAHTEGLKRGAKV